MRLTEVWRMGNGVPDPVASGSSSKTSQSKLLRTSFTVSLVASTTASVRTRPLSKSGRVISRSSRVTICNASSDVSGKNNNCSSLAVDECKDRNRGKLSVLK